MNDEKCAKTIEEAVARWGDALHLEDRDALTHAIARLRDYPLVAAVNERAAHYVGRCGSCSDAPDGDPWDGLCEDPGCDYCGLARAVESARLRAIESARLRAIEAGRT